MYIGFIIVAVIFIVLLIASFIDPEESITRSALFLCAICCIVIAANSYYLGVYDGRLEETKKIARGDSFYRTEILYDVSGCPVDTVYYKKENYYE